MRVIRAGDDDRAGLVIVNQLPGQAFSSWLKLNVKCICVLGIWCTEHSDARCLVPIPAQSSRINRDPAFEKFERVNPGCYRLDGIRMAGRGELVGGCHGPCSTTGFINDKGRYHW